MRFALSAEQRQFAESLRALLADAGTSTIMRCWAAGEHQPGLKLWRQLAELGITGLLIPEHFGGVDAGVDDVVLVCEELGYFGVPGPVAETIAVLPRLLVTNAELAAETLPQIASGELLATLSAPPHVPYLLDADIADLRLHVENSQLYQADPGDPLTSVDNTRRLFTSRPSTEVPGSFPMAAFDTGVLATSALTLGAGRRLLDQAAEHAKQRRQFGREIGQFQAIKHLLADVATQIELARPLLYGAAVALNTRAAQAPRDVSAAKVAASSAAYLAARTSLQVHGAVGYTAEHELSLWLTKVRALVLAWGSADYHRARVAAALSGKSLDGTQREGARSGIHAG